MSDLSPEDIALLEAQVPVGILIPTGANSRTAPRSLGAQPRIGPRLHPAHRGRPSQRGQPRTDRPLTRYNITPRPLSGVSRRYPWKDKPNRHYRSSIDHLGDLTAVWLYRDDKQIKQITYREEPGECSYTVTVRAL